MRLLSNREISCVRIAALFAVGRRDEAASVLEHGLRTERIPSRMYAELFVHLSLLLGFPAMLDGLGRLRDATPRRKKSFKVPKEGEREVLERGRKYFHKIYGKATGRLLRNLAELHEMVPSIILRDAYGRIIARPSLTLREREIINVVVLMIQQLDRQLYSHIRGALRIGVSPKSLRSVILLTARISDGKSKTALEMLSSLASTRNSLR